MRKEHMTYLREILKMGSITAAANHLNITPQALSSAIKILEQELEFDLLKRSNQGVEFTPEGIRFMTIASNFFDELDELKENKGKEQVTVQLNITKEFSSHFALSLIKGISEGNSNIRLDLNFDNAEELKKKLKRREIDSFITITPKYNDAYFPDNRAEYEKTGYQRIYWGEISRLYCLVPKSMAIYNLKNISVKTAAKYPVTFLRTNYETTASIRYILNEIAKFEDEIFASNIIEHKAEILLGKRIGFDFINNLSEWNSYTDIIKMIPLKERIALCLCIITRNGENDERVAEILNNGSFM